jgi:paraquat-inducible protein A
MVVACQECDLLHHLKPIPQGSTAKCIRCGAVLRRHKRNSVDRTLSFALAGLILIVLANAFPFLALKSEGLVQETTLFSGVSELYHQDMASLAALVFLTSILLPFMYIVGMLYIFIPLKHNRLPWKLPLVFRFLRYIGPWGMMEVFMLGILVSMVKLADIARIVPGVSLYAFVVLIFVLAATTASLDAHAVWERWEKPRD